MSPARVLGTLHTDRLIIRPGRAEDAGIYRRLWTERDPRVPPHRRIDDQGRPTVADIAERIRVESEQAGPGIRSVQRKDTGEVIGYCGLVPYGNGSAEEPELVYELLREVHGAGYATEAAGALVAWAQEAGYRRVWAGVRVWNIPSRRVLEKLGFHEFGEVRPDSVHGYNLLTVLEF